MIINEYLKHIIPGIQIVPMAVLQNFFNTPQGRDLNYLLEKLQNNNSVYIPTYAETSALRSIRNRETAQSLNQMKQHAGFQILNQLIRKAMLNAWYFPFVIIDSDLQTTLIEKDYTIELYRSVFVENQPIEICMNKWETTFTHDTQEDAIRTKHQVRLWQQQLIQDAMPKIGFLLGVSDLLENEYDRLLYVITIKLYYSDMNKAEKKELLRKNFTQYLMRCNQSKNDVTLSGISNLSNLMHKVLEYSGAIRAKEYMDRIADAHLTFQIFGLRERSTWILDNIDVYNYVRFADSVGTLKGVLYTFLRPVRSLLQEYVQIANHEISPPYLLLRATIPILVMTCALVFSFSLIVPFAMHALIEIMMLTPALYFSVLVASAYVDLKNKIYESLMIYRYGDIYADNTFQVNQRVLTGLGRNSHLAQLVRDYYISNLKQCDETINLFSKLLKNGLLTEAEINYYKESINRKTLLMIEWSEIHENHYLGVDKITQIVSNRLNLDGEEAYIQIKKESNEYIDKFIDNIDSYITKARQTERSYPSITRVSLFKPEESVERLAQKCSRHQKTLQTIEELKPLMMN